MIAIGTGPGYIEITESEYNTLLTVIRKKATLTNKLYFSEITIDDIPAEWQEEIQQRVNNRISIEGEAEKQEISGNELLTMIEEVL